MLINGRIFVDAKYLFPNPEKHDYMLISSSNGNEEIRDEYMSSKELGGLTVAHQLLSGHWIKPIYDNQQNIIGTSAFFVSESSFGGAVPKWIINKFAPPAIIQYYDDIVKAAKNIVLWRWLFSFKIWLTDFISLTLRGKYH